MDIKKICGYPRNAYPYGYGYEYKTIFIQRVGYEGATTRTLLVLLTSLTMGLEKTLAKLLHTKMMSNDKLTLEEGQTNHVRPNNIIGRTSKGNKDPKGKNLKEIDTLKIENTRMK